MSDLPHSGTAYTVEELTALVKELTRAVNTQAALLQGIVHAANSIVENYTKLTSGPRKTEGKHEETPS